ncbi:MAG: 2-oxoglutarate dehydrogenase E1 component, partial [Alphaproteobacteria bacterium]|nr:2-oxoglutarate dehydrogenase E1 component [Alphaproteobacteria bacterium]
MARPNLSEQILSSANATYIAELYQRFLSYPQTVDAEWTAFFRSLDDDARDLLAELRGASWAPNDRAVIGAGNGAANGASAAKNGAARAAPASGAGAHAAPEEIRAATLDSIRALMLIRSYRVRGHLEAKLDPLGLAKVEEHPELDPKTYGFGPEDMDRPIFIDRVLGLETADLKTITRRVRETYCGSVGVEYMHIQEPDQKAWIQERIEAAHNRTAFSVAEKRWILEKLCQAEAFEHFLDKKYTGTKRFGLEGGEATIPALKAILRRAAELGVDECVLGMAHRGRLNVLANVMAKPFQAIFSEFEGQSANPDDVQGSGDVKYHLGTSSDREFDGRKMHLSLTANPSHLEAVDPVVLGKVRAKQQQKRDGKRERVLGVLLHGDAAFAGQGLVAETLSLYDLNGYRSGGTIHLIINNQIGFTTSPSHGRSSPYCSDVAKLIQAPILHVNGDDPEAVVHVARMAMDFRQRFHKDVVIDLFCYRRHGHNEADEPSFTQPLMYRQIAEHPSTRQIYAERLVAEGSFTRADVDGLYAACTAELERAHEAAKTYKPNKADWLEGSWSGLSVAEGEARRGDTAVPVETLRDVGRKLCAIPEGFKVNRKLVRIYQQRLKTIEDGQAIDWATAESLAFGTLAAEGSPVRLSGQDCGRGTFSQRHAVLVDQESEARHVPLTRLSEDQAPVEIYDSPLAEASVLGFEYGYSLADPRTLVMWEAQFGDFANGAQVIIDQFLAGGESKWLRMSGLVLLL